MRQVCILVACALWLTPRPAAATIVVPWTTQEMTRLADDVVTGVVESVETVVTETGAVETQAAVRVASVLKGRPGPAVIVLRQPGGTVGDLVVTVLGTTPVAPGDPLLVFGRRAPGGGHRALGVGMGIYHLPATAALTGTAVRRMVTDPIVSTGAFTLLGAPPASRWFEFDRGQNVVLRPANAAADLGRARSDNLVRRAFGAWNGVQNATVRLSLGADGPQGPSLAGGVCDGRSVVQFDDPADELPSLTGCSGVLAVGGFCSQATAFGPGGETFRVITEGDVTVNRAVASCFSDASVAEVLTHEIGHVLGLGHSSENASEPNTSLRDATMFFLAHLDGRAASVRSDDVAGIRVLYPGDSDGDRIPDEFDACPGTPHGAPTDATGCACTDPGHAACAGGDACNEARCEEASAECVVAPVDCTNGEPCLTGSCTLAVGCATAPVTGFDAIGCALDRDFRPAECDADRVSRAIRRRVRRAGALVRRARSASADRQERFLGRATSQLERALAAVDRAANPAKRRPLGAVCADRLRLLIGDAKLRIESRGTATLFDP